MKSKNFVFHNNIYTVLKDLFANLQDWEILHLLTTIFSENSPQKLQKWTDLRPNNGEKEGWRSKANDFSCFRRENQGLYCPKIIILIWQIRVLPLPLPSSGETIKPGQNIREYG